jgi:hypothetical protein
MVSWSGGNSVFCSHRSHIVKHYMGRKLGIVAVYDSSNLAHQENINEFYSYLSMCVFVF